MATAYTMSSFHDWNRKHVKTDDVVIGFDFTPASLALNDTFKLFFIPANWYLLNIGWVIPQWDTGGGLTLDLGDSSSATLFLSGDTTGQTGAAKQLTAAIPKLYTSADFITMKAHVAAVTPNLVSSTMIVRLARKLDTHIL